VKPWAIFGRVSIKLLFGLPPKYFQKQKREKKAKPLGHYWPASHCIPDFKGAGDGGYFPNEEDGKDKKERGKGQLTLTSS